MRRALITTALAAAALAAAAPASAAAPAKVRLVDCSVEDREAAFQGRMTLVPGANRMAMRFTLLAQTGEDGAQEIKAPPLRQWHRSKPGVRAFRYRQGFRGLVENTIYRVRVHFRWYSPDGEVIKRAKRRSPACRQFIELPNLGAQLTRVSQTGRAGVWRYSAVVRNDGKGAATNVPLRFTADGDVVDTLTIASLEPGESRSLAILGPECKRLAALEVDPGEVIAETSEEDNLYELRCGGLTNAG